MIPAPLRDMADISTTANTLGLALIQAADALAQGGLCITPSARRGATRIALELVRRVYNSAPDLIAELESQL